MLEFGVILLIVGIPRELIARDWFRGFFDRDYPEQHSKNSEWMKTKLGRAAIVVGAILVVVGGVAELVYLLMSGPRGSVQFLC